MGVGPHLYVTAVLVRAHQIDTMPLLPSPSSWSAIVQLQALAHTALLNRCHLCAAAISSSPAADGQPSICTPIGLWAPSPCACAKVSGVPQGAGLAAALC